MPLIRNRRSSHLFFTIWSYARISVRSMQRPAFFNNIDTHRLDILKGASVALPLKVAGTAIGFLLNLVVARMIGAEGAGIYFLALSFVMVATIIARLGMDNVLLRMTAAGSSTAGWNMVKGGADWGIRVAMSLSIAMAVFLVAAAPFIAEEVFGKPELVSALRWMGPAVIPMTLYLLHARLLQGLKKIAASLFVLMVAQPLFTLLLIWPMVHLAGTNGIMQAYLLGSVATLMVAVNAWKRYTTHLEGLPATVDRRAFMRASLPLLWVSSSFLVMNWMSTFFLGLWAEAAEVGIFRVAERTAALLTFFLMAVDSMASPKFAEFYQKNDMRALAGVLRWSATLAALITLPLFITVLAFPAIIMGIYGDAFKGGAGVLMVIALGQYVNCATGPIGSALVMCNREVRMRNAIGIGAAANILFNLTLTPTYGAIGAAFASSLGLMVMNFACMYGVWKELRIWPLPFGSQGLVRTVRPKSSNSIHR